MADATPTALSATSHRTNIFSEGSFLKGTLTWGWQCFTCREEEVGFRTASVAQQEADNHESLAGGA